MFEEFIRELRGLEMTRGVRVPIDMPIDDKGYLDRKCPHRECGAEFKVLFDDWRAKVPQEAAFCPKCGRKDDPTEFNTDWQNRYIQEFATAYAKEQLNKAFSRAARRTRPKKLSAGLFDIQMKVTYRAGPTPVVLPPSADDVLRQDFECDQCGCRHSAIGTGYFCPACGHNSATKDFDHTIETTQKAIEGIEDIKRALTDKYDEDVAENVVHQILEDQIENLVTAFQRVSEALFAELPNASHFNWDHNLFQRLNDGSELWIRATGKGYDSVLSAAELNELTIMIQRRHKIGHSQGMVDQRYLDRSGDPSYLAGQRLVIAAHHVTRLAGIIRKLATGLRNLISSTS